MTLEQGQILNDRYRIAALIHQTQSGSVYRAWDLYNQNVCVLKERRYTAGEENQDLAGSFRSEAERLLKLDHPNLAHFYDFFSITGQGDYLVIEYIEGNDLSIFLKPADAGLPGGAGGAPSFKGLAETQVIPWMMQVSSALTYLHSQVPPVIHGDIKPENIKIAPDGRAVLVDLGFTAQNGRGVPPTPGYAAPELYGSSVLDPRSDVYSFGATLYTLLTGVVPPSSVDLATGAASLIPARQLNPQISAETDRLIQQSLQTNRNARLPGMNAVNAALTAAYTRLGGGVGIPGVTVATAVGVGLTQAAQPSPAAAASSARPPTPPASTGSGAPPGGQPAPVSLGDSRLPRRDLTQMIILAIALVVVVCVILVSLWFLFSRRGNGGQSQVDPTQAASTLMAQVTEYAFQTEMAAATQTVQATLQVGTPTVPQASATAMPPSATPTKAVCEKATFVSDVTIPDNTVMTPGTAFTKTWKVRNDSTCTWDSNYALVFAGGTLLSRQNTVNFPGQVPPGGTTDLSIDMTAPLAGGSYQSNWLLRSPGGTTFGVGPAGDNPLFVRILVTTPVQPNPAYAFDFTARSCDAQWRTAAGVISCNNISSDPRGSAIALAASPSNAVRRMSPVCGCVRIKIQMVSSLANIPTTRSRLATILSPKWAAPRG